jgi:hypothetical protein
MQIPKLQLDEMDDFPNMTSPLRPYTDHPFPNSLNQEDYMKLLNVNSFSNPELVDNLLDIVVPNPVNYSDTNQQVRVCVCLLIQDMMADFGING